MVNICKNCMYHERASFHCFNDKSNYYCRQIPDGDNCKFFTPREVKHDQINNKQ